MKSPSDKDILICRLLYRITICFTLVFCSVLVCCEPGREVLDVGKECVVSSQRPGQPDVCGGAWGGDLLLGRSHRGRRRGRQRPGNI